MDDYCINCNFVIPFGKCFGKENCVVTSVSPLVVFIRVCTTMNLAPVCAPARAELCSRVRLLSPGQMTLEGNAFLIITNGIMLKQYRQ